MKKYCVLETYFAFYEFILRPVKQYFYIRTYIVPPDFILRSSHLRCSVRKGVLRNFAKFTGKHLCESLFFNKISGLRPAILFKKRFWHRYFPVNFSKSLTTPFLTKHLRWRLLKTAIFKKCNFLVGLVFFTQKTRTLHITLMLSLYKVSMFA